MLPLAASSIDSSVVLIAVVVGAIFATLVALVIRNLRKGRRSLAAVPTAARDTAATAQGIASVVTLDGPALLAAVKEAEAEGASHRLPGLYLSLAQSRLAGG